MSSPWQIHVPAMSVELPDGRGEVSFTITNASPRIAVVVPPPPQQRGGPP